MTEKRAAKFSDYDNKALLSSGSESDQEYTDIFESIGTGQILLSTSFDDGDSKSVSDSEIVGYTGDIETYIGSNNDESDCNETVPKLPEDQLIDFRSESTVNNQISKDEGSLIKGGLSEFNNKLLVITNEKNLRPGKPIQVKPMEDLNTSKSDIQSEHDHTPDKHNTKTILEDEVTKSFEVFDPLSEKNVNESSLNNTSSKTSNKQVKHSNRKRPRHRIYLDDPDIHQLISEHVELLRCKMAGVDSKEILKAPSFNFQSHHMTTMPDLTSHNNTATKKKIALNGLTSNLSSHIPSQQNYSIQFKSNQNLKTRRGQNLISRIRNENISSEDDDEYTERLAKALYEKNSLHQICPDCGEYHSQEEDDEDICPDCGVSHNPYQHSPIKNNSQKKIERDNSCIKTNVKSGNRYQQITSQQDPRDEMEDSLPSIEGPLSIDELTSGYRYRLKYLGSCQIITQHPVTKETRLQQAQDAYKRIKAQDGEDEVSTNVDMCISLERIKVINKDTKFEDVMMDHALRTVCFICDMGKILVLMARRLTSENSTDINFEEGQPFSLGNLVGDREKKSSKNICHVFEGVEDTSSIAKAIGQAFNVAYRQFLKSNGIAHELVEEAEYSHVLESQIIIGRDLENLTDESAVREVVVVKKRGDPLGIMLLESGWGSMLPTVFVAHIANYSATAQCQKISVGDHILACDGISLVGLPLSECTAILKNCRAANRVSFRVVTCPTVVDVVLLRPDVKYQLGFSVQDGTICSMLRGGIAERAGVRVGHRIIEINGDSVVAKSHQYIIDILAHTIGSISMKTMPIALYRLMVGEELPQHV